MPSFPTDVVAKEGVKVAIVCRDQRGQEVLEPVGFKPMMMKILMVRHGLENTGTGETR